MTPAVHVIAVSHPVQGEPMAPVPPVAFCATLVHAVEFRELMLKEPAGQLDVSGVEPVCGPEWNAAS